MKKRYYHNFITFLEFIGLFLLTGATCIAQVSESGDPFCGIEEVLQGTQPPAASYPSSVNVLRGGKYKTASGTVQE